MRNSKSSRASSTVACDGARLFINFFHGGAIYTTSLSRKGKQLWQTKISDYVVHQGYGSSPAIYQSMVIVSADNKMGGAVAALDRLTGNMKLFVCRYGEVSGFGKVARMCRGFRLCR